MARAVGEKLRCLFGAGRPVRPGASSSTLDALEKKIQVVLPADFRDYLTIVDGMESGAWLHNEIEFWRIERILEELDDWGCFEPGVDGTLLPFADFLINSHAYAIRVSSPDAPVFYVAGKEQIIQCATSFEDFVDRYERDDDSLYGGGLEANR